MIEIKEQSRFSMKFLKIFILLFIFFLLPGTIFAYERVITNVELKDNFSIAPIKYDLQLKAGTKTNKQILVTNSSSDKLNFQVSVEDFIGSANPEEGTNFLGEKSGGRFSLKDWIKPEINNFTLQPKEQIKFNVEINIPESAETGSHYAALFVEAQNTDAGKIQASSRLSTLFLVSAQGGFASSEEGGAIQPQDGQISRLAAEDARLKFLRLDLPGLKIAFENNYQTHLVAHGKITVFDLFHRKAAEINIGSWYILPESIREKTMLLPDKFFLGPYGATAEFFWQNPITGAEDKDIKKISFWLMPWKIVLPAAALLIIILAIVIFRLTGGQPNNGKSQRRSYLFFLMVMGVVLAVNSVNAVMTSENYKIMKDSISVGGIETGNSTNYGLADTAGEINGDLSGTNYGLRAGYRVPTEYTLSISTPSSVAMSSCTNSASGCSSQSSVSWTVTTDYANGYTLSLSASTMPAMKSSASSFPDFSPTSGTASLWSVDSYSSAFGFSIGASGETDVASVFKDDGTNCNAGSNVGRCYRGFNGTNSIQVVSRSSAAGSGNATTVSLKAEVGKNYNQPAGTYSAIITATAAAL